jgi:hypothetical protein
MATVLEECTTKEQRSVVRFLWAKGLHAKDIGKEMFPVYGEKYLSCKAVHNSVEKFSQGRSKCCFFQVQISLVLHFIAICDLFTDSPFYFKLLIALLTK